jgi:hypothetical protein
MRSAYRVLVGKPEGKDHLQDLDTDGSIVLMDLKELGMSSSVSGLGPVVVSCDRSNKTSVSF